MRLANCFLRNRSSSEKRGMAFGVRSRPCRLEGLFLVSFALLVPGYRVAGSAKEGLPILLYHRFAQVPVDSMTVSTTVFASQLKYLRDRGYAVVPLRQLVACRLGKADPPLPRSVAITADDG